MTFEIRAERKLRIFLLPPKYYYHFIIQVYIGPSQENMMLLTTKTIFLCIKVDVYQKGSAKSLQIFMTVMTWSYYFQTKDICLPIQC